MWPFLKDLETEIPFVPAIPLLGIYPEDYKSFYKDTCTRVFTVALFTIAKTWNQPKCPLTIDWTGVAHIHHGILCCNQKHIHHGILCSNQKNENMFSAGTWMKLEDIILSKLTQEQKIKHHVISLISGS